ncbi:MAG: hypothetical protein H7A23_00630 [Leptospiraceae bacterium]|nr:hypothetical protein [Leptospiraceae bacterium]
MISLRTVLTNEYYCFRVFPNFSWNLAVKLEYLTMPLGALFFLQYINLVFPGEMPTKFKKILLITSGFLSLVIIFTSPLFFTTLLQVIHLNVLFTILISIYTMFFAVFHKRSGAKPFLFGFIIFAFIILNDILHNNYLIYTGYYSPLGFLIFISSQSYFLSIRFSRAFAQVETLSEELSQYSEEITKLKNSLEIKVEERTKDLEEAKSEIEALNHFTQLINSLSNLNTIFTEISKYVYEKYKIKGSWLFLPDKNEEYLYAYKAYGYDKLPENEYQYVMNKKVPLSEEGGILYLSFKRQKPLYISKITKCKYAIDKEIVELLNIKSFLCIPLLSKNRTIGLYLFSNLKWEMKLSKKIIQSITNLCYQISGVIETVHLLKLVLEEKEKALEAQGETERIKNEVEFLNEFSKSINSSNVLEEIFSLAVEQLNIRLEADFFLLQLVQKDQLFTRCLSGEIAAESYADILKFQIPLDPKSGFFYIAYSLKKTFYLKTMSILYKEKLSEFDLYFWEKMQFVSVFQIPLLIRKEVIGIMNINKIGGMKKLSRDEILFCESLCEQLAIAINNSRLYEIAEKERQKSERLLLNILPKELAEELKEKGSAEPVFYESASVLFTDFKGFTQISEKMSPQKLVAELDGCFVGFDSIIEIYKLEKLKTIGDSYMCVGGIPKKNSTHPIDSILAAMEIQKFIKVMKEMRELVGIPYWELRIGIHTGPLVAGVIGEKKFTYGLLIYP